MKSGESKTVILTALCALISIPIDSQSPHQRDYVPNAETAVAVAEAVLKPVYGAQKIESERPFKAILTGDVWTVEGTVWCSDGKSPPKQSNECAGGAAEVKLSKRDAHIISMIHYK